MVKIKPKKEVIIKVSDSHTMDAIFMINSKKYFIVFLLIGLFSFFLPIYADPPLPTPVGRVVWVKGTLTALMPNNEKRILQKTSVIYLHDTLMTDDTSQAQIAFTDNSLMTFRPSTKFLIDQYNFTPTAKKGSVGKYLMRLIEGGFRTITGLIAKDNPVNYQINTPVATIGVRGTDYAVYFHAGEMFVGYYSGTPCVTSTKNSTLCLSANTPYASVPSAGAAPVPLSQQPAVFKVKLDIIPVKIEPFTGPTRSGLISSFCITQ